MAIYRTVHITFWTDPKVDDDFTPEDKYFYLYLLTNPHTTLCGCYEISMKQMVRETGYNEDTVKRLLKRMEYTHGVAQYDQKTKEVFIPHWGKYNWVDSNTTRTGVARNASTVKSARFRKAFFDMGYPIDAPYIPHTYPTVVSDTDTDTDSDSGYSKKKHPTVEEVRAYCEERGNKVDPETFVDFYESKGWLIGKNPMKDWKAAVRTWERSDTSRSRKNNTLLNYKEKGKSHDNLNDITFSEDEL